MKGKANFVLFPEYKLMTFKKNLFILKLEENWKSKNILRSGYSVLIH